MKKLIFLFFLFIIVLSTFAKIRHVKATGTGDRNGGTTWINAFSPDTFGYYLNNLVDSGDVFYVKDSGTLTLTASIDFSARDGGASLPIFIIGVKDTVTHDSEAIVFTDWSKDTTNNPFFDCGSYSWTLGDYTRIFNCNFQGDATNVIIFGTNCLVEQCKFDQDYGSSAGRYSIRLVGGGQCINSYFISTNCSGINPYSSASGWGVINCIFENMKNATGGIAIYISTGGGLILNSIFDSCRIAIELVANAGTRIINNTFYDNTTSIDGTITFHNIVINNILDSTKTDGFKATGLRESNFLMANHGDNTRNNDMFDTWSEINIWSIDNYITSGNPLFTNPSNYDFTLQNGSPCLNTGKDAPTQ